MKQYLFFAPLFLFVIGAVGVVYNTEKISVSDPHVVDLSGKELKEIPDTYKDEILRAEIVILDNNYIESFPEWMLQADKLRVISINNNPHFDLFKFSVDFQSLTEIEKLSASGCNIKNIPYQLTFFTKLKDLNLSYNKINHVPYHFSFLTSLIICDLSNNQITEVGYSFRDLRNIKYIDISSNTDLNIKEFCNSIQFKELEYLKIDITDSVPELFAEIQCKNLNAGITEYTVFNGQFANNTCTNLQLRNLNGSSISKNLETELSKMNSVGSLVLKGFEIVQWPASLKNLKSLNDLEISGCGLNSVANLESLPLKTLGIKENNLSLAQIRELKLKMPSCIISSDEERLAGHGSFTEITPPVESLIPPVEKKIIDPKKAQNFVSESGTTTLNIPSNAFVDANGKPVTTPVEISFTEYNNPVSIALSGIPMQIKNEDGTTGDFSSAGMFNLEAASNGKEVFPNPNALITANISSPQTTPYNLYGFREGEGWVLAQSNPVIPASSAQVQNTLLNAPDPDLSIYEELSKLKKIMNDSGKLTRSSVFEPKIGINFKRSNSKKTFTLSFTPLEMTLNRNKDEKYFIMPEIKEMNEVLRIPLKYNDYNYTADMLLMDSIRKDIKKSYKKSKIKKGVLRNKKTVEKYYWDENIILKDISVTPDPKKDDYVLRFNYRGKVHSFHVVLADEGFTTAGIQKRNEKYMQNYFFANRLNKEARERKLNEYKSYYDAEEKRMKKNYEEAKAMFEEKYAASKDIFEANNLSFEDYEKRKTQSAGMVYTFQVSRFGVSNCDIVSRFKNPKPVRLKFKDVLGKTLIFLQMIRIDKRLNMITAVSPNEALIIDYDHKQTALMFIIDNDNIAVVDSKTLAENRDNEEVEVKIIPISQFKAEKVRAML